MLGLGMDIHIIRRAVEASQTDVYGVETADLALDVLAVFDADWERHVLTQHWDHTDPAPRWVYCLWHVSEGGATLIGSWRTEHAPLIHVAALVMTWKEHGHYGGQSSLDIADIATL